MVEYFFLNMTGTLGRYSKMRYRSEEERNEKATALGMNGMAAILNDLEIFEPTSENGYFLRVYNGDAMDNNVDHFEEFYPVNDMGGSSEDLPMDLVKMVKQLDHLTLFTSPERKSNGEGMVDWLEIEMKYNNGSPIFVRYEAVAEGSKVYGKLLKALASSKK